MKKLLLALGLLIASSAALALGPSYYNQSTTPPGQMVDIVSYGASAAAADNATALQAAITAAITQKIPLHIPSSATCFKYTAPLSVTGNLSIIGDSVQGNWPGQNNINAPGSTPALLGSVLCPTSNGQNAINVTGDSVVLNITNLGILFQTVFVGTGNAINYVPTTTQGMSGSFWQNVIVYGHDGNHYGFTLQNAIYNTFIQCQTYGGGGWNLTSNGATGAYGNAIFLQPLVEVLVGGTANGISLNGGGVLNQFDGLIFLSPEVGLDNQLPQSSGNPPTNAQFPWVMDAFTTDVRIIQPNFGGNVSGLISKFNVISGNGFDFGTGVITGTIAAPSWGTNGIFCCNGGPTQQYTDTTSSGTVAVEAIASFPNGIVNATNTTLFNHLVTLYLPTPVTGTNVSVSSAQSLYATGEIFTTSDYSGSGGAFISGTVNFNKSAGSNVTEIGDGTTNGQVTIGGGSNPVVINGNQGGYDKNTALISTGTKFTITGCGVSVTTGGAAAGTYTSGTTGTCTVVVTINGATGLTAPNGWACGNPSNQTTAADTQRQSASTATTATITGTTVTGDVISFACMGY